MQRDTIKRVAATVARGRDSAILEFVNAADAETVLAELASAIKNGKYALEIFTFDSCPVSAEAMNLIADALILCSRLRTLSFRYCGLDDACAAIVARIAVACPALTQLDITGYVFTDVGVKIIADALPGMHRLADLLMTSTANTDAHAAIIAKAIVASPSLALLHMHGRDVGRSGIAALTNAARRSTTLDVVHVCQKLNTAVERAALTAALLDTAENVRDREAYMAFMGATVPRDGVVAPIYGFLSRDGDNAIGHRILAALLRRPWYRGGRAW